MSVLSARTVNSQVSWDTVTSFAPFANEDLKYQASMVLPMISHRCEHVSDMVMDRCHELSYDLRCRGMFYETRLEPTAYDV